MGIVGDLIVDPTGTTLRKAGLKKLAPTEHVAMAIGKVSGDKRMGDVLARPNLLFDPPKPRTFETPAAPQTKRKGGSLLKPE